MIPAIRIVSGADVVTVSIEADGASITIAIGPTMAAMVAAELLFIAQRVARTSLRRVFNRHLRERSGS